MADDPLVERLVATCRGRVSPNASLAERTTLKVGGRARALVVASDEEDLAAVGRVCRDHGAPWLVVGRGSNLLVADRGWPGVAIALGSRFREHRVDGDVVTAGAAAKLPVLANAVARLGLTGFEWAVAVPGSMGGAVRMNAGAHGHELVEVLRDVDVVRLDSGTHETWPTADLDLRYRSSSLPEDAVVVAARLRLVPADHETVAARMSEIRRWRRAHQPVNEPSCGSVFTNPPGDSAGRLVDTAGGKRVRVGAATVSDVHANFIVTRSGATAGDVARLVRTLQQRVADVHGVWLAPEVVMVGEFDDDEAPWPAAPEGRGRPRGAREE